MALLDDFRVWAKYFVAPIARKWNEFITTLEQLTGGGQEGPFKFSTITTVADPGSGYIRCNNSDPASTTTIVVSETDDSGDTATNILANLRQNDQVTLQSQSSSTFYRYTLDSDPVDQGVYWELSVTYEDHFSSLADEENIDFIGVFAAGTFIALRDTPDDYVGHFGAIPQVDEYTATLNFNPWPYELREPNGFIDGPGNTNLNIVYDAGARKITLEPKSTEFIYYYRSIRKVSTGKEVDITSYSAYTGLVYIFIASDLMYVSTGPSVEQILRDNVYVAALYENGGTQIFLLDERHGTMGWLAHRQQHYDGGAVYVSGLALNNVTADQDGNDDEDAEFGLDSGYFLDEDIEEYVSSVDHVTGDWPVIFLSGSTPVWNMVFSGGPAPVYQSAGVPYWNELSGGSWQATAVGNNKYFCVHIFACNIIEAMTDVTLGTVRSVSRRVAIMGQAQYDTKPDAEDGAATEINSLLTSALPMEEFLPIATVIYRRQGSNTYGCAVQSTGDGDSYFNWLSSGIGRGTAPASHKLLSDRDAPNQHPAASVAPVVTGFGGILSSTDDTVQKALDTIDDHNHDSDYAAASHTHVEADITDLTHYDSADFDDDLATKDTDDLAEGTNLYFTNARADARIAAASIEDLSDVNSMTPSNGDVLTWDNANSRWDAEAASSGGAAPKTTAVVSVTNSRTPTTSYVAILNVTSGPYILHYLEAVTAPFSRTDIKLTVDGTLIKTWNDVSSGTILIGPGSNNYPLTIACRSSLKIEALNNFSSGTEEIKWVYESVSVT